MCKVRMRKRDWYGLKYCKCLKLTGYFSRFPVSSNPRPCEQAEHSRYLSMYSTLHSRTEHNPDRSSEQTGFLFAYKFTTGSYLELVESECKVKNFCKLLSKSLLSLQVLRWWIRSARQGSQETSQSRLWNERRGFWNMQLHLLLGSLLAGTLHARLKIHICQSARQLVTEALAATVTVFYLQTAAKTRSNQHWWPWKNVLRSSIQALLTQVIEMFYTNVTDCSLQGSTEFKRYTPSGSSHGWFSFTINSRLLEKIPHLFNKAELACISFSFVSSCFHELRQ